VYLCKKFNLLIAMIKKQFFIFVLLLLVYQSTWAQRDFRKGFIITNRQDTVFGWIDYRGDARNARMCSFRETESGQITNYAPADIEAYRFIDSKYYISRDIGSADAPKQVFLEYLVDGLAKLFYYREKANDQYFIEKDGEFHELKVDEEKVLVDGRQMVRTRNTYIGLLKSTLNIMEMNDEIENSKLVHSSLMNIAINYHHHTCPEGSECIVYEKRKPLLALRVAPVVGVDFSTLTFMNYEVVFREHILKKQKFEPSYNFTVGVNLNFSMPRINEKFFVQMQALYSKYYFFDTHKSTQSSTDIHVGGNVLQMGLAMKYEYPKGKWRPTLAVGVGAIWLPDGKIEENTDNYSMFGIHPSIEVIDFTQFTYGVEVIPGIHYYLNSNRIIFLQAKFLQCNKKYLQTINYPANKIRSFGLSAGMYF